MAPRKLAVRQGTEAWLAARREHITATDIPVLLGLSPWRCEADLADEKLGGDGEAATLRMRVGHALEDLIAGAYAEQTGRRVRRVHGLWESSRYPWAAASPDATAEGRLVELKWTGSRSRFAGGLPEDIEAQCQWQALVAEVPEVDVAALTVGDDEVRLFTVSADEALQRDLIAIAADFRRRLAAGGPFARNAARIRRDHPSDNGEEMDADPELAEAVRALLDVRASRKRLEADEETLETAIKARMGDCAVLRGQGWRVTWRRTKDRLETDWRAVADEMLRTMPETERAALVGRHEVVRPGFRPFRISVDKED